MDWKKYFDADLKTTLLFSVLGVIIGYVSFLARNNAASFVMMIIVAVVARFVIQKRSKEKKDAKWWLGNGIIIYIFIWFVSWTIFYNITV
jgi:hypothetical protein